MSYPELVYETSLSPGSALFVRDGDDLALWLNDERVLFEDYFIDGWTLQEIRFTGADGTILRREQVEETLANGGRVPQGLNVDGGGLLEGSAYADALYASAYGAHLLGHGGNDRLAANNDGGIFDVVFEGGEGNDELRGSYARDVYRFERGDGRDFIWDDVRRLGQGVADYFHAVPDAATYQDRVEFGAGIRPQDLSARRVDDDLVIDIAGGDEGLRIFGWYDGSIFNRIESFVFSDGTTWLGSDLDALTGVASTGKREMGGGTLVGSQFGDELIASAYGTTLLGGAGNDLLTAWHGDGGLFDLVFEGGAGNDSLQGTYARDVYRFDRGDGHDIIRDDVRAMGSDVAAYFAAAPWTETYQDRVEFGAGIRREDVTAQRVGMDLVLTIAGGADSLTVRDWYDGTMFNKIESFVFADGSTWMASEIDRLLMGGSPGMNASGGGTLQGSQYDDTLAATGYGTELRGGMGNDNLAAAVDGGVFNLVFDGGKGDDRLTGSYAGDVYRYSRGDGRDFITDDVRAMGQGVADYFAAVPSAASYQDRLEFGAGIAASDVDAVRVGEQLLLYVDDELAVAVSGWFDGTLFNRIESVDFADGTSWLAAEIDARLGVQTQGVVATGGGTLQGSQYHDSLTANTYGTRLEGGFGNDTLTAMVDGGVFDLTFVGGLGDDVINGSYARDFFHYGPGDGHDLIRDDSRALGPGPAGFFEQNWDYATYQDRLVFGAGIAPGGLTAEVVNGDDVLIHVGQGSITVENWFEGTMHTRIEQIAFADGTVWEPWRIDRLAGREQPLWEAHGGGHFVGTQYDDSMYVIASGTRVEGLEGNDYLTSRWTTPPVWDVTFVGGLGNDFLEGSEKRDTYVYNLGDGSDYLYDDQVYPEDPTHPDYQDRLLFGEGITPDMIRAVRASDSNAVSLVVEGPVGGGVTIDDWFWDDRGRIELIGFADGTTWTAAMVEQMVA